MLDFYWAYPGINQDTTDASTLSLWRSTSERARNLPTGTVKGGRRDVIYDSNKSARFFRRVLEPLLAISQRWRDAIFAWELINEPEWITRQSGLGGSLSDERRVPLEHMLRFLERGLAIIAQYGFRPTVGFASSRTLGNWDMRLVTRTREALAFPLLYHSSGRLGLGLNQFHYYPQNNSPPLPTFFPNGLPGILGEFGTLIPGSPAPSGLNCNDIHPDHWPDLDEDQSIQARLRRAKSLGYSAALPWSYRGRDCHTASDRGKIESAVSTFNSVPKSQ